MKNERDDQISTPKSAVGCVEGREWVTGMCVWWR